MSSREVTIAGFVLFAVVGVTLELWSRRGDAALPSFGDVLSWIATTTPGRVGLMLVWWWAGWHFFAR